MSSLIPILRFIHIFSAIFWVGTTLFMVLFLEPTVRNLGPDGGKFMQSLLNRTRFSLAISASAILTVLAGLGMFGAYTGGWSASVMLGHRLPLTMGAIAGIAAAVVGAAFSGRISGKISELGQQMSTQGGPPRPEQLAEMQQLQVRMRRSTIVAAVLMVIAVVGMTW
ncbi:MAG: hypothetical protein J5I90_13285 [Caldilineales bacterium]|nr:hypothetical protein [Caldilineales bacterium]